MKGLEQVTVAEGDLTPLIERARRLAELGGRRILGIAGAPGVGKSTCAEAIVSALGESRAALVPMDGYHLAEVQLHRLGRHDRKGAIDTFDGHGYVHLLRRLRDGRETVYAPQFRRDLEEPIAGAIAVPPEIPLVVTEGNYLLVETGVWGEIRGLLDEGWFLVRDEEVRLARLLARHRAYGRTPEQAAERTYGSDQTNAELIAATRRNADLLVRLV